MAVDHDDTSDTKKYRKKSTKCLASMLDKRDSKAAFVFFVTVSLILSWNFSCYGFLLDGTQNSFAQFRKWCTGLNGSMEFEFKTEQPNGLVLYTDDGGTFDFFEIKLVEGAVRLRYNLGGGANIITVGRDLHDGHWHKVQVNFIYICIYACVIIVVSDCVYAIYVNLMYILGGVIILN